MRPPAAIFACLVAVLASAVQASAQERPAGSQDVLPLLSDLFEGARYALPAAVAPVRPALSGLLPGRPIVLRRTVVSMDDDHSVVQDGNVLVSKGRIAAVWSGATPPPGIDVSHAQVIDAGPRGLVFPGLINLHDHPSYDVLSLWPPPSSHAQPDQGRPTGSEPYANRYQWNRTGPPELRRLVENPEYALNRHAGLGLGVEVLKRAETRAALGGQTALQGEPNEPALDGLLVRNADGQNFGRDHVESRVRSVEDDDLPDAARGLRQRMDSGQLDAWLAHLAEGVRDSERPAGDRVSSRAELDRIRDLGLLTDATVVLHGVGLERSDFAVMRRATRPGGDRLGAKLVWAPLSNLLLYGRTANIYEALAEGLTVSLGTDWAPSGSNTLLGELKVADLALRDAHVLGNARSEVPALRGEEALDRALVDMVTRNPARTLHWSEVGTIAPGKIADLLVLRRPARTPTGGMPDSPYRSLIDATERDVALVLTAGKPIAGDVAVMRALQGRDFEVVTSTAGGYAKAVDLTDRWLPKGRQRLARIEGRLLRALRALGGDRARRASGPPKPNATFSYLRKHFDGGRYRLASDAAFRDYILAPAFGRVGGHINLEPIALKPLLSEDDDFFLTILEGRLAPATGLPDDPTPPFALYKSNQNHKDSTGHNPLGKALFFDRWYGPRR